MAFVPSSSSIAAYGMKSTRRSHRSGNVDANRAHAFALSATPNSVARSCPASSRTALMSSIRDSRLMPRGRSGQSRPTGVEHDQPHLLGEPVEEGSCVRRAPKRLDRAEVRRVDDGRAVAGGLVGDGDAAGTRVVNVRDLHEGILSSHTGVRSCDDPRMGGIWGARLAWLPPPAGSAGAPGTDEGGATDG